MQLADFLDFDAIKTSLPAGNKRSLLQQLSNLAAQRLGTDSAAIYASLVEREQLGSTGFGQGVAIPHGKIEGLSRIYGLFARLSEPLDYKAIDGVRWISFSSSFTGRRRRRAPESTCRDQPGHAQCSHAGEDARRAQQRCSRGCSYGGG